MAGEYRETKGIRPARQDRHYLIYLAIALLTVAVYWQVARFEFVNYDDDVYVTENVMVQRGLSLETVAWAFTTNASCNWHPLAWISHLLDVRLHGADAAGHHITSLLLHIANALLLLAALSRMTGRIWRSAFVALLFAIHPLHVESVAWIAERKDVLCTLFWMLAMLAYVGYARHPRAKSYLLLLLALAAGLMSKPMLVSLPIVLILLDYWPLERPALYGWKRLIVEKLPLLALVAASSTVTFWAHASGGAVAELHALPLGMRLANASVSCVTYVAKMFWPAHLAAYYPHPNGTLPTWQVMGSAVLLGVVTTAVIRLRTRAPYLLVGWLWYLITLVPVIGLVQVGDQAMADRYTYIPLIGLFIATAWGVATIAERLIGPRVARVRVLSTLAVAAVVALSARGYVQVGYWKDSLTLFGHTLEITANNPFAEVSMAMALSDVGRGDEAVKHYENAIRFAPRYPTAHGAFGMLLARMGRLAESEAHLRRAVELCPNDARARNNLGGVLLYRHKAREAIKQLSIALTIDPNCERARYNLELAREQVGSQH